MSVEYDEYLDAHVKGVRVMAKWLIDKGIVDEDAVSILLKHVKDHDNSKTTHCEYSAYDEYFYGEDEKTDDVLDAFNYAWLNHIHHNPHHWQYWVLFEDDGPAEYPIPRALEIPKEYVYEMIADWLSFGFKEGDLRKIFSWYEDHKTRMILHEDTRALVEKILDKIKEILDQADANIAKPTIDEIISQYLKSGG